jgi:3-hydroxyacyl-[acyl-carrier-protein] dehydratase
MSNDAMDLSEILDMLPHRYPFLLVDRVLELKPGEYVKTLKNITLNEPQFMGHFPGNPVMPGVLILETMAQTGGLMLLAMDEVEDEIPFFAGIDKVRWRKQVHPGDQLVTEAHLLRKRGKIGRARGVARVDGEVACEGVFTYALL